MLMNFTGFNKEKSAQRMLLDIKKLKFIIIAVIISVDSSNTTSQPETMRIKGSKTETIN